MNATDTDTDTDMLPLRAAAHRCGLSQQWLRHLIGIGKGPKAHRFGRWIKIAQRDLDEWIATAAIRPTAT
jgi:predicted DNA-binding transcriptional regulator AlpA